MSALQLQQLDETKNLQKQLIFIWSYHNLYMHLVKCMIIHSEPQF